MDKKPHRLICGLCHREYAINFWVPNEIWEAAVHIGHINDLHCLNCFIERADAQLLPWDKHIKLFPESLLTHLQNLNLLKQ